MGKSNIEWTDNTYNPIRVKGGGWHCVKVSEGCQHCYAESVNQNSFYGGGNGLKYAHQPVQPELELRRDVLAIWARKTKPSRNFVASMTDVFGEFVPDEWIYEILDAMLAAPLQTFQVLTKRHLNMRSTVKAWCHMRSLDSLPPNIWLGVSVENQARANERIPVLMDTPAIARFLSVEPLIGPVDLEPWLYYRSDLFDLQLFEVYGKIDWVIVGGESGPKARPMELEWVRTIRDQCKETFTPFFFKQWGGINKSGTGRLLDGVKYSQFPDTINLEYGVI